jgi:hypothetical protein
MSWNIIIFMEMPCAPSTLIWDSQQLILSIVVKIYIVINYHHATQLSSISGQIRKNE